MAEKLQFESEDKTIKIQPASSEDVDSMQDVFYKTWLDTYPNEKLGITIEDIQEHFKDYKSEIKLKEKARQIQEMNPNSTYLLAKEDDRVVGLCRVEKRDNFNQLHAIYVLPEYQKKGIALQLWEQAKKNLDQNKDTIVQLAEYNAKAISFYEKLGFIDSGKRWIDPKFKMKSGAIIPEMEMILKAEDT